MNILIKIWNWYKNRKSEGQLVSEAKNLRERLDTVEEVLRKINLEKLDSNINVEERIKLRQATCRHLKGGLLGRRVNKDYAVRDFRFIDGRREVACLICGKKWTPEGRDWDKALEMLEETTNSASSSETPARVYSPDFSNATDFSPIKHKHSDEEVENANKPRNLDEENPIRGRKFPQ